MKKVLKKAPPLAPPRSFHLSKNGWIVFPSGEEWRVFFLSHYGILILLVVLIVNFSYINVLAAPPPADDQFAVKPPIFVSRVKGKRETLDSEYKAALSSLFRTYIRTRGEFALSLKEGSDSDELSEQWMYYITQARETLLAMSVSQSMKEVHLNAVFVTGQDEEAARAIYARGITHETEIGLQEVSGYLSLFIRAHPWIAPY